MKINRKNYGKHAPSIPQPLAGQQGKVVVDSTWGIIQPMQAYEGVETIGELEVIEYIEKGRPVVDGRTRDFFEEASLPGAINIPYTEAAERMDELDQTQKTILFCNGPQCPQSPRAIRALIEAGFPPDKILYYRGGMHDWMTLGLPTTQSSSEEE